MPIFCQNKKGASPAQGPPLNLLDRPRDFKPQPLAFMHDFRVPFDNNLAERDVRMVWAKTQGLGVFRTLEGEQGLCAHPGGSSSTGRKNAVNVSDAIRDAFCGKPFTHPAPQKAAFATMIGGRGFWIPE